MRTWKVIIALYVMVFVIAGCTAIVPKKLLLFRTKSTVLPHGMHGYGYGEPVRYLNEDNIRVDHWGGMTELSWSYLSQIMPIVNLNWSYLEAAKGSKSSLDARLDVSINEDGTLK